jgi:hypothetical protein
MVLLVFSVVNFVEKFLRTLQRGAVVAFNVLTAEIERGERAIAIVDDFVAFVVVFFHGVNAFI